MSLSKSKFCTFTSLFLVLVIDAMGFALIMPILAPLYLDPHSAMLPVTASIAMRDFCYGLTMAVFFVSVFFGAPFMGDFSDQIGRRKVLIICLLGVALGFLISALGVVLKSISLMIAGRIIGGFTAGSQSIAQAAIIDISTDEKKAINISLITLAGCLGFVIGPIIGGYFSGKFISGWMGYSVPFFVAALLALINAVGVYFTFNETFVKKTKEKLNIVKSVFSVKTAFKIKNLRVILLVNLFFEIGWGIYFQFLSLYLVNYYHYTPVMIGIFIAVLGVWFSLSLTLIIRVAMQFIKIHTLTVLSLLLMVVGVLLNVIFSNEIVQWVSTLPSAVGAALTYTNLLTIASDRVDRDSQGMVMGVSASLSSIGWVAGGLSMGLLSATGAKFPFIAVEVLIILGLLVLVFFDSSFKKVAKRI